MTETLLIKCLSNGPFLFIINMQNFSSSLDRALWSLHYKLLLRIFVSTVPHERMFQE